MKTILVYGDSNTWGAKAGAILKYSREDRWVSIFQERLGDKYKVLPHGLVGRHAGSFAAPILDGQIPYETIYRSVEPVDIVIIALGGNDMKEKYNRSPEQIVEDILWYEIRTKELLKDDAKMPIFIYVLQPKFYDERFSAKKRRIVNRKLKKRVDNYVNVKKVDLSEDELHFSEKGHLQMSKAVYKKVMEIEE